MPALQNGQRPAGIGVPALQNGRRRTAGGGFGSNAPEAHKATEATTCVSRSPRAQAPGEVLSLSRSVSDGSTGEDTSGGA